jgi:hypothetical protein
MKWFSTSDSSGVVGRRNKASNSASLRFWERGDIRVLRVKNWARRAPSAAQIDVAFAKRGRKWSTFQLYVGQLATYRPEVFCQSLEGGPAESRLRDHYLLVFCSAWCALEPRGFDRSVCLCAVFCSSYQHTLRSFIALPVHPRQSLNCDFLIFLRLAFSVIR